MSMLQHKLKLGVLLLPLRFGIAGFLDDLTAARFICFITPKNVYENVQILKNVAKN